MIKILKLASFHLWLVQALRNRVIGGKTYEIGLAIYKYDDNFNQSHTTAEVTIEILNGKGVSAFYWHDYVLVTKPEEAELVRKDSKNETVEEVIARYAERKNKNLSVKQVCLTAHLLIL